MSAPAVEVMLPLSVILTLASMVRLALPPAPFAVVVMSAPACCTIFPVPAPVLLVVSVTLVPVLSASEISTAEIVAVAAVVGVAGPVGNV